MGARETVRLEMYIFRSGVPGDGLRAVLVDAARRGVRVRLLLDALGCGDGDGSYWAELREAGGIVRTFHRFRSGLAMVRNHRKLLVCDERVAVVAGFNVAPEYDGDGVAMGWRDAGVRLEGGVCRDLAATFDRQFERTEKWFRWGMRLRRRDGEGSLGGEDAEVLAMIPGRGKGCLGEAVLADIRRTGEARGSMVLVTPYFVPPSAIRKALRRAARRGASVTIVLPAHSDVGIAQRAARHLYAGLLRAGVRIVEYQPQMLHAKIWLFSGAVYVGSSNLDPRSFHLNYELMMRLTGPRVVSEAKADVRDILARSRSVDRKEWRRGRTWLDRLREQWAFWVLYRIDPWLTAWAADGGEPGTGV